MKCKNCANEISDDSTFCSFCGLETETNFEKTTKNSLITDQTKSVEIKDENPALSGIYRKYYIAGLVFLVLYALKHLLIYLEFIIFQSTPSLSYKYVYICIDLAMAGIPILLSRYTQVKNHKIILLIIGLMLMVIGLYRSRIMLPYFLGVILYLTPYLSLIVFLWKTKTKSWHQILIGFLASTIYGIILVFASMGRVIKADYYGIAHLAIVISYPVVNLIIVLVYRLMSWPSNKS